MDLKAAIAMMLVTVMLAGCSKEEPGPTAEELCDGMFADGICTPHTEPSIIISGLEDTVSAYVSYPFTWTLDNGTRPSPEAAPIHSMYNYLGAVTDGSIPTNVTDPEVTPFGSEVALLTHQNLPINLTGTFTWNFPGETVALWGYMRFDLDLDGKDDNVWAQLMQISVITPPETDMIHDVTFDFDPTALGTTVDEPELTIGLGDGVSFVNNADFQFVVTFEDCEAGPITVAAGATSTPVHFFEPDTCNWDASSQLSATGTDPAALSGSVRISA